MTGGMLEYYQTLWMFESHAEQRLAWRDAEDARRARLRAEAHARAQAASMLAANPEGQLGSSTLNDAEKLKKAGLL